MSAVLNKMRSLSRTTGHGAIFGVAGFSGSGKTTLAEKLICCFCERNIEIAVVKHAHQHFEACLLYTSPSPRDATLSRMPSSA